VHSLQVRACRASMAKADIHAAKEQVFVLRCGRRLRAQTGSAKILLHALAARLPQQSHEDTSFRPAEIAVIHANCSNYETIGSRNADISVLFWSALNDWFLRFVMPFIFVMDQLKNIRLILVKSNLGRDSARRFADKYFSQSACCEKTFTCSAAKCRQGGSLRATDRLGPTCVGVSP
jgi:hypothetical protein